MEITLTKKEKKLIKRIASLHLQSLKNILENETEEDVLLFCIENSIDESELKKDVLETYQVFEEIHQCPEEFFIQDDEDMSISKHMLYSYFKSPKWEEARKSIHRKIALLESDYFNYLN